MDGYATGRKIMSKNYANGYDGEGTPSSFYAINNFSVNLRIYDLQFNTFVKTKNEAFKI